MPIYTYVENSDPNNKIRGIELEGGLILYIGTYANLTSNQLNQIRSSGLGIVLKEGIIAPANPAVNTGVFSTATIIPEWQALTTYKYGQTFTYQKVFYRAIREFTSGETFVIEGNCELLVTKKQVEEAVGETYAQALLPTAVKVSEYTASPADYVRADISSGSFKVKLPKEPADATRIGLKLVKISETPGSTTLTVEAQGEDVFNISGGGKTLTLEALNKGSLLQYQAKIWTVQVTDTPLNTALGGAKLGTDGTVGGPNGSPLSSSIGGNKYKYLGEGEGTITPNISEGNWFEFVLTGNTKVENPSNWPSGASRVLLTFRQNSSGGHSVIWGTGITPLGISINVESNGETEIELVTVNGGSSVKAISVTEGLEGPRGKEGEKGEEGPKGEKGEKGEKGFAGSIGKTKTFSEEQEGTVHCNLEGGVYQAFVMTIKGNVTVIFENWPEGNCEPQLYITQNSVGGHTITVSGLTWYKETPEYETAANAETIIPVASKNGGLTITGIADKGPKGEKGEKGSTGEAGPGSPGYYTGLLVPYHSDSPKVTGSHAPATAFKTFFSLYIAPRTGHIKKVLVPNGTVENGNTNVGILDVGVASAEHYTLLSESGSVAQSGISKYQSITIPEIAVTVGEVLMIGIMNSGTTGTYGIGTEFTSPNFSELPAGSFKNIASSMGVVRLAGVHTYTELKFTTELAKASMEAVGTVFQILGIIE